MWVVQQKTNKTLGNPWEGRCAWTTNIVEDGNQQEKALHNTENSEFGWDSLDLNVYAPLGWQGTSKQYCSTADTCVIFFAVYLIDTELDFLNSETKLT